MICIKCNKGFRTPDHDAVVCGECRDEHKMKRYIICHLDGNGENFIVEAETAGQAKWRNYCDWREVFSGRFREYLERLRYCRVVKDT